MKTSRKEIARDLLKSYPEWDFRSYKGPDKEKHRLRVERQAVSGLARALGAGVREGELKGQIDCYSLYVKIRKIPLDRIMPPNVFAWGGRESWNVNGLTETDAVNRIMMKTGATKAKAEVIVKRLSNL